MASTNTNIGSSVVGAPSAIGKSMTDKRITFQALLANELGEPYTLTSFEEFIRNREHSEENLEFLEAVTNLRSLPPPWTTDEAKKLANNIVTSFLLPGAPKEVNCPNSIRKKVIEEVQAGSTADPAIFVPIEVKTLELIRLSSFPHFLRYIETKGSGTSDIRPASQSAQ